MPRPRLRRTGFAGVALAAGVLIAGWAGTGTSTGSHSSPTTPDPRTRQALLRIAVRFNENYAANRDGLVYDRWDARSRLIISRAQYVLRHAECPTAPGRAVVDGASQVTSGFWRVLYSISGTQLTDYWRYEHGRWRFDLERSNPNAVKLYRLPFAAYAAAVGCTPSR